MATEPQKIQVPNLALPKGGGAIQGIGESFQANEFSGTAGLSIPIPLSPCRDFSPELSINYGSGSGNGPFGMGFSCSLSGISRQTEKGTPRYKNEDTYLLPGSIEMVKADAPIRTARFGDRNYHVTRYLPRHEDYFSLVELWQADNAGQEQSFWKITSPDHVVSIYGKSRNARITNPETPCQVYSWLLEECYDSHGQHQLYYYKAENKDNVLDNRNERHRVVTANRYLKGILYGNHIPVSGSMLLMDHEATRDAEQWFFEVVFDYGEYDLDNLEAGDIYSEKQLWSCRPDPFSSYNPGFEIRTYRLCRNILLFHRFQKELGDAPVLVHRTGFDYESLGSNLSFCTAVRQTGYSYDPQTTGYSKADSPSLDFGYTAFEPQAGRFMPLTDEQGNTLSGLNEPPDYQFIDLYGEGLPGIFYRDGSSTLYREPRQNILPVEAVAKAQQGKPNVEALPQLDASRELPMGYGPWLEPRRFPLPKDLNPAAGLLLQDVTGNGQPDLVLIDSTGKGYWEAEPARQWLPFRTFQSFLADFPADSQDWVDMTGNGIADLVQLNARNLIIYPSARGQGFGPPIIAPRPTEIPTDLGDSAKSRTVFAGIDGSGRAHLVHIRDGQVQYLPNLGYGRFGKAVHIDNAPVFGPDFQPKRLILADLDGSGSSDLIYLETGHARVYFNQNGNRFSDPIRIPLPVPYADGVQATVADIHGNGNQCLILSAPHPQPRHWAYDFCRGHKPYLLNKINNNLGAETTIEYASSVTYYQADKKAGLPWLTPLPFPVQVVARVLLEDTVSRTRYARQYAYHHGFYDGLEREFRGFGRVDRQDCELTRDIPDDADPAFSKPVLTRSWYHTGSFLEGRGLSRQYAHEYFDGDPQAFAFPDSHVDWGTTDPDGDSQRQAAVAMAGALLRTEVYGLDKSHEQHLPFTVSENSFSVRLLQAKGSRPYAVFFMHQVQTLNYDYERNPHDPRITQSATLKVDDFGNITESCELAYPRRLVPGVLNEQLNLRMTYALQTYVNQDDPDSFQLGVPIESKTYEILDLDLSFEPLPGLDLLRTLSPHRKNNTDPRSFNLLAWTQHTYVGFLGGNETALPLYQIALPLLVSQTREAVLTQDQVTAAYGDVLSDKQSSTLLKQGYYQFDDAEQLWWDPGLNCSYNNLDSFYLPKAFRDQAGNQTTVDYDPYHLMPTVIVDPLANQTQITQIDYTLIQPLAMVDLNGNTSETCFDPLGRVIYTSFYGHENGKPAGFDPIAQAPRQTPESMQAVLDDPASFLGNMRSFYYYDPFAWQLRGTPICNLSLTARDFPQTQGNTVIQTQINYIDGFGRTLCSQTLVDPGPAYRYDPTSGTITTGPSNNRWWVTDRVAYTNKGEPFKKYEPYFIDTSDFIDHHVLNRFDASVSVYHDPLGRIRKVLSPRGFWKTMTYTPWQHMGSDHNDTLTDSPYYRANISQPDPNSPYYEPDLSKEAVDNLNYVAQWFLDTPDTAIFDNLGQVIREQRIRKSPNDPKGTLLTTLHTYDITGNLLTSSDPRLHGQNINNLETQYDLRATALKTSSVDAGRYQHISDVFGNVIWSYDQRQTTTTHTYDPLHRPFTVTVQKLASNQDPLVLDQTVEVFVYGDSPGALDNPESCNLRGKIYQHYDQAGLLTINSYSLLGAPLTSTRRFNQNSDQEANWNDISPTAVAQKLQSQTYSRQLLYNALGLTTKITDEGGNITVYSFNQAGQVYTVNLTPAVKGKALQPLRSATYDAWGTREKTEMGNGTTSVYTYHPKTRRVIRIQTSNSSKTLLQDLRFEYDPQGNLIHKSDNAQPTGHHGNLTVAPINIYSYDSLYQIISATGREAATTGHGYNDGENIPEVQPKSHGHDHTSLQPYTELFNYDDAGNMIRLEHHGGHHKWVHEIVVSNTSNHGILNKNNGNHVPKPEEVDSYFDASGNQLQTDLLFPLVWNYRNNLAQATTVKHGDGTCDGDTYIYDGSGNRVRKISRQYASGGSIINSWETLYFGTLEIRTVSQTDKFGNSKQTQVKQSVRVSDGDLNLLTYDQWVTGDPPSGFSNPVLQYHLDDQLGSCMVEVDDQGNQISYEEYSAYGASMLFLGTGSADQLKAYRYAGKERDQVTGFYYYGARYYVPWAARWLSADPAGPVDGLNLYAFLSGNPTNHVDIWGLVSRQAKKGKEPQNLGVQSTTRKSTRSRAGGAINNRHFWQQMNEQLEAVDGHKGGGAFVIGQHDAAAVQELRNSRPHILMRNRAAALRKILTYSKTARELRNSNKQAYDQEKSKFTAGDVAVDFGDPEKTGRHSFHAGRDILAQYLNKEEKVKARAYNYIAKKLDSRFPSANARETISKAVLNIISGKKVLAEVGITQLTNLQREDKDRLLFHFAAVSMADRAREYKYSNGEAHTSFVEESLRNLSRASFSQIYTSNSTHRLQFVGRVKASDLRKAIEESIKIRGKAA